MKKDNFIQSIILLFIGFFLTAVVGNWIAGEFQKRSFDYQHRIQLQESEVESATRIFEEISKLTDKRIYAMHKLNWSLKYSELRLDSDKQMSLYRDVLYEWNNNFNRNRSLIQKYFGTNVYEYFSDNLHSAMREDGSMLEEYYYTPSWKRGYAMGDELDGRLSDLENKAYELNIRMLSFIQKRQVGIFNSESSN